MKAIWGGVARLAGLGLPVLLYGCGGGVETTAEAPGIKSVRMAAAPAPAPAAPTVEIVKEIASDGSSATNYISNQWGGHQARITRHLDGSVRILYLRPSGVASNPLRWSVQVLSPGASWREEVSGLTTGDVNLLRDPNTDTAFVLAFPDSKPTVYAGPSYTATLIPGSWQPLPPSSRHYSAAGIGADGTLCFKTNVDLRSIPETSRTRTDYICGKYVNNGWQWGVQNQKEIGARHSYDYLFPGGFGVSNQLVASAQLDLHMSAAGYPSLPKDTYVFNGISVFTSDIAGTGPINKQVLLAPYTPANQAADTVAPTARMHDSFIDSSHRLIATYYGEQGSSATTPELPKGFYTVVTDASGKVSSPLQIAGLPAYGKSRLFEDGSGRMWLLWTVQGSQITLVKLYRVTQDALGRVILGAGTDLSSSFLPYSIDGAPRLALTFKGQVADNVVEGMFAACQEKYSPDHPISSQRYPSGDGNQRIVYFRIRLPN